MKEKVPTTCQMTEMPTTHGKERGDAVAEQNLRATFHSRLQGLGVWAASRRYYLVGNPGGCWAPEIPIWPSWRAGIFSPWRKPRMLLATNTRRTQPGCFPAVHCPTDHTCLFLPQALLTVEESQDAVGEGVEQAVAHQGCGINAQQLQ